MAINVRKFALQAHSLDKLVGLGSLTTQATRLLGAAVACGSTCLELESEGRQGLRH
jgi:pilus assembly protein CpaF